MKPILVLNSPVVSSGTGSMQYFMLMQILSRLRIPFHIRTSHEMDTGGDFDPDVYSGVIMPSAGTGYAGDRRFMRGTYPNLPALFLRPDSNYISTDDTNTGASTKTKTSLGGSWRILPLCDDDGKEIGVFPTINGYYYELDPAQAANVTVYAYYAAGDPEVRYPVFWKYTGYGAGRYYCCDFNQPNIAILKFLKDIGCDKTYWLWMDLDDADAYQSGSYNIVEENMMAFDAELQEFNTWVVAGIKPGVADGMPAWLKSLYNKNPERYKLIPHPHKTGPSDEIMWDTTTYPTPQDMIDAWQECTDMVRDAGMACQDVQDKYIYFPNDIASHNGLIASYTMGARRARILGTNTHTPPCGLNAALDYPTSRDDWSDLKPIHIDRVLAVFGYQDGNTNAAALGGVAKSIADSMWNAQRALEQHGYYMNAAAIDYNLKPRKLMHGIVRFCSPVIRYLPVGMSRQSISEWGDRGGR